MKFISYTTSAGPTWGVVVANGVVPSSSLGSDFSISLTALIDDLARTPERASLLASRVATAPPIPQEGLALLPCISHPGKIICLGVNYADHAKEGGRTVGDYPSLFLRCATSLAAHGAPIAVPSISHQLDFEAELAVVIGRSAKFVSEEDALDHVFAYACFNDVTLRDYQRKTTQWTIGKNFDGTGGFGPVLVTPDELPPGCTGLRIQSRLNGQIMQDANTEDMVFGVAKTIALLSECVTLEPGDVLVMGTPGGVGYARTPPVWMKAGDTIEIEIEGVGILSNTITA